MTRPLALMIAGIGIIAGQAVAAESRPNILFVMSDDHALEAIGCYGSWLKDFVHTPTIDRLATEGMRFTNCCCNNSICSPSRASIITGQYSHINGGRNLNCSLAPDSPSYIVELQKAGYQTSVFGKWHMRHQPRGCDSYAVTKGQGSYFNPTFHRRDGSTEKHKGYYADVYTDKALAWLEQREPQKPFCLNLHFKGPHHPYDYPARHERLLDGTHVPEPASLHEDLAATSPLLKKPNWSQLYSDVAERSYYPRHETEFEHRSGDARERRSISFEHMINKYIRCVAAIDENLKRVLDYLEGEQILDNTIVIYTSDQGYWLGQHGLYDKRLILEESLKMPLIVRFPREVQAGSVCDRLAMNIDFGPTMLDFANVAIPESMQGTSLRPLLGGRRPKNWRTGVFYAYYARSPLHWGIRTERYTLVHFPQTSEIEFYDLKSDPFQMRNVARQADYAAAVAATEAELRRLMDEVGIDADQLPGGSSSTRKPKKKTRSRKASTN